MKQSEKGIAHIGVIIAIVAAVAVIGFGGWFVWDRNRDDDQKDNTAQTTDSTQNQAQQNEEETPADPSEGGKYLVIEEWGVRFLLPEELRGDIYFKTTGNSITNLERASFASSELDSSIGDLSCSFKKNPQVDGLSAGLLRLAPQFQPTPEHTTDSLNKLKRLRGYEYFTARNASPPITCLTGQHEEFNDVEQSISGKLNAAFETLENID